MAGGGCFHYFIRCVGNRNEEPIGAQYKTKEVESIKFENLLLLEQRERDARVPLVSDSELEHVREGRLDRLAEEQLKLDREKDEELRKQEEQLRLEEEAYYAAKRKAAKKTKQPITVQPSSAATKKGSVRKNESLPSWLKDSSSSLTEPSKHVNSLEMEEDDEDFDIFLKNVKEKNESLSGNSPDTAAKLHSVTSDDEQVSEDEIDFGYWESAASSSSNVSKNIISDGLRPQGNLKEIDLNLL